jgi:Helix-loop-helix DNA-binding domain
MPRPNLPPTPLGSTDISGQEKPRRVSPETSFILPPPAMLSQDRDSPITTVSSDSASASSYNPATPTSPTYKALNTSPRLKRTSSGSNKKPAKEDITLPPPPTRPRKIIHMKPKNSNDQSSTVSTSVSASKTMPATPPSNSNAKRKTPSSTSVAGRKIARKTAHSLIERRRRSKMNEEFGTLKDMIPACDGQEMHKLAILQASIDYVRYLENCVRELKEANKTSEHAARDGRPSKTERQSIDTSAAPTTRQADLDPPDIMLQVSPTIMEPTRMDRHYSFASSSTGTTATPIPSPAFGPHLQKSPSTLENGRSTQITPYMAAVGVSTGYSISSASPSPNILPQPALDGSPMDIDHDHEATAALLMLTNDRRGIRPVSSSDSLNLHGGSVTEPRKRATAMSVKELLST